MYSQLDPQWANRKMGNSPCTIGRWGCTITSICNLINDPDFNPAGASVRFKFTPDGLLIWQSDFTPLRFVERIQGWDSEKEKHVKQWIKAGHKAIIQVSNKYIPFHWVSADRVSAIGFITGIDPLGDKPIWNIKSKYTIIGGKSVV